MWKEEPKENRLWYEQQADIKKLEHKAAHPGPSALASACADLADYKYMPKKKPLGDIDDLDLSSPVKTRSRAARDALIAVDDVSPVSVQRAALGSPSSDASPPQSVESPPATPSRGRTRADSRALMTPSKSGDIPTGLGLGLPSTLRRSLSNAAASTPLFAPPANEPAGELIRYGREDIMAPAGFELPDFASIDSYFVEHAVRLPPHLQAAWFDPHCASLRVLTELTGQRRPWSSTPRGRRPGSRRRA